METRSLKLDRLELRAAPEGSKSPGIVEGVAVPYNQWTSVYGEFDEMFVPGAFDGDQPENQFAYSHHNWDIPIASTRAKTLTFIDGPDALRFRIELPDTSQGRDAAVLVARGDLDGASIGFKPKADGGEKWELRGHVDSRTIQKATLVELSLTHLPIYKGAKITALRSEMHGFEEARAVVRAIKTRREAELAARERESVLLSLISRS